MVWHAHVHIHGGFQFSVVRNNDSSTEVRIAWILLHLRFFRIRSAYFAQYYDCKDIKRIEIDTAGGGVLDRGEERLHVRVASSQASLYAITLSRQIAAAA